MTTSIPQVREKRAPKATSTQPPFPSLPAGNPHTSNAPGSQLPRRFRTNLPRQFSFTPRALPHSHSAPQTATQAPVLSDALVNTNPPQPSLRPPPVSTHAATPKLQPPPGNSAVVATQQFYVRPFDPSTSAEQIAQYISCKTGWGSEYFRCFRLASASRRNNRPLSFVSFKILVVDHPTIVNTIANQAFWPNFVSVEPFTTRQRK